LVLRETRSGFESAVLENLDAAHNLARWLTRNDHDAEEVVQEACLKGFRAFDSFRGGDFRAWFLTIVRNTSFTLLSRNKAAPAQATEQSLELGVELAADDQQYDPQLLAVRAADADLVRRAIEQLPVVLRETVVLRELEGLSYKEVARITGVPIGTVMSRLARGRAQLQALLMTADQSERQPSAQEGAQ
jgi:RNA polymerase sigma-70 factor (ECF subfamily)